MATKPKRKKQGNRNRKRPIALAIKPATPDEYLWKHPEIVEKWWREHCDDYDELVKEMESPGRFTFWMENGKIKWKAEKARSRKVRPR